MYEFTTLFTLRFEFRLNNKYLFKVYYMRAPTMLVVTGKAKTPAHARTLFYLHFQ